MPPTTAAHARSGDCLTRPATRVLMLPVRRVPEFSVPVPVRAEAGAAPPTDAERVDAPSE
jgi:hypothetical protein